MEVLQTTQYQHTGIGIGTSLQHYTSINTSSKYHFEYQVLNIYSSLILSQISLGLNTKSKLVWKLCKVPNTRVRPMWNFLKVPNILGWYVQM